jgi:aldehyde:ferredoxin oxidoreductase
MLEEYYLARGWDEKTGDPLSGRLGVLGLKK